MERASIASANGDGTQGRGIASAFLHLTVASAPSYNGRRCWSSRPRRRADAPMSEFTKIMQAIESGDALAAERLLPLVYEELRRLAAAQLAHEQPGQTLQPTALVHEA